jgi:hypothetical protein
MLKGELNFLHMCPFFLSFTGVVETTSNTMAGGIDYSTRLKQIPRDLNQADAPAREEYSPRFLSAETPEAINPRSTDNLVPHG